MATSKKISQLTAVVTPAGSDTLAAKQASTTKKLTVTQLLTLQDGPVTHTGEVIGSTNLTLDDTCISGQAELASGLVATDELLVSDGGTIKRIDLSVLEAYLAANLTGQAFGIQFFLPAGEDATFIIDQSASFAYTIVDAVADTVTGTITMEVNIDGTEVTGIDAMAIGTSETTDTASGQNSVAAGATVDFIFTANSSAVGLSVKLNCTRD